ncbi:MAG: MotA/TolQ/ExbB proton channel family protein [Acidobacteria bacterium]|nr:MotA/TolQ/ExbB proton channel family protein [Acidobacteriota bacterium]MBI3426784.1 MotA/TolQ/ExbB proton channel family protein [Acidobacteriota bacterium]
MLLLQEPIVPRTGNLVDLLFRSSPIAKFVLLLLLVFSLISWAIIIAKEIATRKAQQQTRTFLQVFGQSQRLSDLRTSVAALTDSPLTAMCNAAEEELRRQPTLSLEAVQRALQSTAIDETTRLERSLGWLASTASAAPFIGLFGTVVGIIIAFEGLSTSTTTSIQAVAPGIAEALIATAAGIAAAVPAVLAYNHYLNRIKVFAAEMDSFSLRLLNLIEREAAETTIRNPQSAIRN